MTGEAIITLGRIVTLLRTQSLELFQSLLVLRAEMSDMGVRVLLHVSVGYFVPSMRATYFGARVSSVVPGTIPGVSVRCPPC